MEEGSNNFFIALKVPGVTGCHITVVLAKSITQERENEIREQWKALFRTLIQKDDGIVMEIGNYKKMGSDQQFEAYRCKPKDPSIHGMLKNFYRNYYSQKEGKRMFPDLKMHITVDTPQRMTEIENLIRNHHGIFVVTEYMEDYGKIRQQDDWKCVCGFSNYGSRNVCKICLQSKQKRLIYEVPPQPSAPPLQNNVKKWYKDWDCQQCGNKDQFGSRANCKQCGGPRPESARIK